MNHGSMESQWLENVCLKLMREMTDMQRVVWEQNLRDIALYMSC